MGKFLIVAAVSLALGACIASDATVGPSFEWRCDDGAAFTARMTANGNAEVSAGGHVYRLPGVPVGSGVRYTDGRVEYWEHGDEAMLNNAAGGPYNNCRGG